MRAMLLPACHDVSASFSADSIHLSFSSAHHLPSSSWEPPALALLHLGDEPPEPMPALALGSVESAWADTVRASL